MEFLYFLEGIRMPILNEFMLLITHLGEETVFLAAALIMFWCVDKRRGYLLMSVGFLGTMANQVLKLSFRVPRPWVLDPEFTILEQAREAAAGYSFPSGHTTSAVGTFGAIATTSRKRGTVILCAVLAILVGLSRMYIGVHTPEDVLVGALTALFIIVLIRRLPWRSGGMDILVVVLVLAAAGFMAFVQLWPFPADMDANNLASGVKNAYTMAGCMAGVLLAYHGEKRYVNFTTRAVWWAQILKVILGLALVLGVKEGLRAPLEALLRDPLLARAVRYFLMVVAAGFVWPMTFRFFYRLGKRTGVRQ